MDKLRLRGCGAFVGAGSIRKMGCNKQISRGMVKIFKMFKMFKIFKMLWIPIIKRSREGYRLTK